MKPRAKRHRHDSRRVTLVAHRVAKVGGMERAFAELAEGLLRRGFHVKVIAHRSDLDAHPNLSVHLVRCPHRPFLIEYPLFAVAASWATWRHSEGLVHVLGANVMNRADVVTVQFCHHAVDPETVRTRGQRSSPLYRLNSWGAHMLSLAMERVTYRRRRARWLIPVARGVASELRANFPDFADRMTIIPNGVDRSTFRPSSVRPTALRGTIGATEDELIAIFVGGDWERKGLRFAIEALARVHGWHLVVVGEGPVERFLTVARELRVESRVHFMGRSSEPASYFGAGDAFVLPTAYEAFPLVMLEAAASGLPLVITRVNGSEEFVHEGVNGFFVTRDGDSVADALLRLKQMGRGGRRALGAEARRNTEAYTWDRVVNAHVTVYEKLSDSL